MGACEDRARCKSYQASLAAVEGECRECGLTMPNKLTQLLDQKIDYLVDRIDYREAGDMGPLMRKACEELAAEVPEMQGKVSVAMATLMARLLQTVFDMKCALKLG